ncbi:MAG: hypothetical protein ACM3UU_11630 [Ignavibacteriales bacterium]
MQDESIKNEQALKTDAFLQEILKKISKSNSKSVVAATAPDAIVADLVQKQLLLKGYKASTYGNVLSVYIH